MKNDKRSYPLKSILTPLYIQLLAASTMLLGCSGEPNQSRPAAEPEAEMEATAKSPSISPPVQACIRDAVENRDKSWTAVPPSDFFTSEEERNRYIYWGYSDSRDITITCLVDGPKSDLDPAANAPSTIAFTARTLAESLKTYVPPVKDAFERTEDYEKRIASERAEFEAKTKGIGISPRIIEQALFMTLGPAYVLRDQQKIDGSQDFVSFYNPDTGTYNFDICQLAYSTRQPRRQQTSFCIPLQIAVPPEVARTLDIPTTPSEYFKVATKIERTGSKLILREVSLIPIHLINPDTMTNSKALKKRMDEAGISFMNLKVNYEFPYDFDF